MLKFNPKMVFYLNKREKSLTEHLLLLLWVGVGQHRRSKRLWSLITGGLVLVGHLRRHLDHLIGDLHVSNTWSESELRTALLSNSSSDHAWHLDSLWKKDVYKNVWRERLFTWFGGAHRGVARTMGVPWGNIWTG